MDSMTAKVDVDPMMLSVINLGVINSGRGAIEADMPNNIEIATTEIRNYVKAVSPTAAGDCLDGRTVLGTLDSDGYVELRPCVAGGPAVTGGAAAEIIGWFGDTGDDSATRQLRIMDILDDGEENGSVIVGGHCDDGAVASDFEGGKTGCGAADRKPTNVGHLGDEPLEFIDINGNAHTETTEEVAARLDFICGGLQALLGEGFDPKTFDKITNGAGNLIRSGAYEGWTGKSVVDGLVTKGKDRVTVLENDHRGQHGHREWAVVVNMVEGTTVDQNAYNEATGLQIFNVDSWYIQRIANRLATGPNAEQQAKELFVAGVAYQLGTYYTLANGSQHLIVISK